MREMAYYSLCYPVSVQPLPVAIARSPAVKSPMPQFTVITSVCAPDAVPSALKTATNASRDSIQLVTENPNLIPLGTKDFNPRQAPTIEPIFVVETTSLNSKAGIAVKLVQPLNMEATRTDVLFGLIVIVGNSSSELQLLNIAVSVTVVAAVENAIGPPTVVNELHVANIEVAVVHAE